MYSNKELKTLAIEQIKGPSADAIVAFRASDPEKIRILIEVSIEELNRINNSSTTFGIKLSPYQFETSMKFLLKMGTLICMIGTTGEIGLIKILHAGYQTERIAAALLLFIIAENLDTSTTIGFLKGFVLNPEVITLQDPTPMLIWCLLARINDSDGMAWLNKMCKQNNLSSMEFTHQLLYETLIHLSMI